MFTLGWARVLWISKASKGADGVDRIRVYWIETIVDPKDDYFDDCPPALNASVVTVDMPVSQLPIVHLNMLLHEGVAGDPWYPRACLPFEKRFNFKHPIDFSPSNRRSFKRRELDESDNPFLMIKSDRLKEFAEADSTCLAVGVDGDPYGLIFPMPEILRFFYCQSTVLATAMFDGRVQNPKEHFYIESESSKNADGSVSITLRKGMLAGDARTIAQYYLDPLLCERAEKISSLLNGQADVDFKDILALPPFDCAVDLDFYYVDYEIGGRKRRLVTRIIHSKHKPAFENLTFKVEENDEPSPDEDPTGQIPAPTESDDDGSDDNVLDVDNDGHNGPAFAKKVERADLGARFLSFAEKPCKRERYERRQKDGGKPVRKPVSTKREDYATSRGFGAGGEGRGQLEISPPSQELEAPVLTDAVVPEKGREKYRRTIALLKAAEKAECAKINYVKGVFPHFAIVDGEHFNVYPLKPPEFGPKQRFHLMAKDKGRMVLVAEVRKGDDIRYLVDFQQDEDKKPISYQVFWRTPNAIVADAKQLLKQALISFAATYSINGSAHVYVSGLQWGSFKHRLHQETENIPPNWIVDEIFAAKPK